MSSKQGAVYAPTVARTFYVLLFGMVFLGMAITVPGVAWPSVSEEFNRPIAQLGFVSFAYGSGYTIEPCRLGRSPVATAQV